MASRGNRYHNGVDIICPAFSPVCALVEGVVTKMGYPYSPKDTQKHHYRYLEIADHDGFLCRYFYVQPVEFAGADVAAGQVIGHSQPLDCYPMITQHFHFEVFTRIKNAKVFLNPTHYLEAHDYELW